MKNNTRTPTSAHTPVIVSMKPLTNLRHRSLGLMREPSRFLAARKRDGSRMSPRLRWRKFVSGFMLTMTGVCALVGVRVLFFIVGYVVFGGGLAVYLDFFSD